MGLKILLGSVSFENSKNKHPLNTPNEERRLMMAINIKAMVKLKEINRPVWLF